MPHGDGYWIKENNGEIKVIKIKFKKHIEILLQNPEQFGYTREYAISVFDKYNEPYGLEGKAREELILGSYKLGWIRVREYDNGNHYSIQCDDFSIRKGIIDIFIKEELVQNKLKKKFNNYKLKINSNSEFQNYLKGIGVKLKISDLKGFEKLISIHEYITDISTFI